MRRLRFENIDSILLDHVLDSTPFTQMLARIYQETRLPMIVFDVSFNLIACCFPRPFYIPGWEQLAASGTASETVVLSHDYFRLEELILKKRESLIVDTAGNTEYKTAFGPVFQDGKLIAYAATVVEDADTDDVIRLNNAICNTYPLSRASYLQSTYEKLAEDLLQNSRVSETVLPGFREQHPGPYSVAIARMDRLGTAKQNYVYKRFAGEKDCFAVMENNELRILFTRADHEAERYSKLLRNIEKNYRCRIGLSDLFDQPAAVENGLRQAELALAADTNTKNEEGLIPFTSRFLEVICLRLLEQEGPETRYYLPRIERIRETQAKNAESLLGTLRTYLENGCSISAAATILNVHKNTVRYRLELIRTLLSADPEEPDTSDALLLELTLDRVIRDRTGEKESL